MDSLKKWRDEQLQEFSRYLNQKLTDLSERINESRRKLFEEKKAELLASIEESKAKALQNFNAEMAEIEKNRKDPGYPKFLLDAAEKSAKSQLGIVLKSYDSLFQIFATQLAHILR